MSLLDLASLVLAPTATKEGKVYSAIPDTGEGDMTFSRGSSATRINSEGLIEKERANFVLHSNDFSQSNWVKLGAGSGSAAIVTSGFSDPDGGSNAWRLQCDLNGGTTSNDQSLIYQGGSLTGVFAFSYYVKSNTGSSQDFAFGNGLANYENGTATTEWQRFTAFFNCPSNNNTFIGARGSLATDDTLDILIYAAQLEQGLVAQPYIETTTTAVYEGITDDVPRVDYTDSSCPALLLEPQRTNILPQSEYVNSTDWDIGAGVTITNNYAESPEGVQNATRAQFGATGVNRVFFDRAAATSDADNVWSFYIKGTDGETIDCYIDGNATGTGYYYFGKYITLDGTWQRIEFPFTLPANAGTQNYVVRRQVGNTATEALFYGFQVEASASYATSYIPTYSVSSTRVADSCSKTGISELIGQSEGTLFLEASTLENGADCRITISDNTINNRVSIEWDANADTIKGFIGVGGNVETTSYNQTNQNKIALTYDATDARMYINGVKVDTDTSVPTLSGMNRIDFSNYGAALPFVGNVYQMYVSKEKLTDDQCIALTK